jgi:hypothetical protein
VSAYIRERLRKECAVRGVATKIAHATGFSSAHITNIQKDERGVGEDLADALATYWRLTPESLRIEAERWAKENPNKVSGRAVALLRPGTPGDPYPNRTLAAQLAREAGIAEEPIASVLAEDVPPDRAGWPALWWADRMRRRELDLMGSLGTPAPGQVTAKTPPVSAAEKKAPAARRKAGSK